MIALTDTGLAHLMKAAKPLAPKDRRYWPWPTLSRPAGSLPTTTLMRSPALVPPFMRLAPSNKAIFLDLVPP